LATAVGNLSWRPLLATSLGNLSLTHDLSLIHDPNTPKKTGDASVPMGDHDDSTEIQQNLEEYEGQLVELRALLKESDEDAADEIQAVIKDLEEAVELSKELLETAKQREGDRAASHTATESSAPGRAGTRRIEAAITEAPEVKAPAVLGAKVKQQLRERQQRAALEGKVEPAWAIGAPVRVDGGSGREGVVRGVSEAGSLIVTFTGGEEEAAYEAGTLMYLDDSQRQNDERQAMQSLARGSGVEPGTGGTATAGKSATAGTSANAGTSATAGKSANAGKSDQPPKSERSEKKRKHGDKTTNSAADRVTNSWQSFKSSKKVSKKMTGVKPRKESKNAVS